MGEEKAFHLSRANRWVERLHRIELLCGSRRWTKPVAVLAWAGFMTTIVSCNPVLRRRDIPRAVARVWLWQIWRRTRRMPVLMKTFDQNYFLVPAWNKLGSIMIAVGLHEPREELFVASYVRAGDLVLDVGANVGVYTVAAANRGARVYAFEPSTQARQALEQNVSMLHGRSVEIVPAALAEESGQMAMTMGLDVANHLVESAVSGPSEVVRVLTLDELTTGATPQISGVISLIKIDAEGFDDKVLKGGERTILRDRPILIVETWGDGTVRDWLEKRGFSVYLYSFETSRLLEYPKGWKRQANLIAVHYDRLSSVQERLTTATASIPRLPTVVWSADAQRALRGRVVGV